MNTGTVKRLPQKRKGNNIINEKPLTWANTKGASTINSPASAFTCEWYQCKSVVSINGDICNIGSWVYAKSPFTNEARQPALTGKIIEILQNPLKTISWVILDVFEVSSIRHIKFGMPILLRRMGEVLSVAVPACDILFDYNTQHDCSYSGCSATGTRNIVQEREKTQKTESYIQHKPVDRFIINTHSFHNAHLIRDTLPRTLTAPLPYTEDRKVYHDQIAHNLRGLQDEKRAVIARKAEEKRAGVKRKRNNTILEDRNLDNVPQVPDI